MGIPIGTKVVRVTTDNFPICRVGDVGVVCAATPRTIKYFGDLDKRNAEKPESHMTIVDFGETAFWGPGNMRCSYIGSSPQLTKHLEIVE